MAIGSLGYHDPYMLRYHSITIRFLIRISQYHPLLDYEVYKLEEEGLIREGLGHTPVLRDAPSIDISPPLFKETPTTPIEVPSTPPVVPLVASSPQSIDATLVDKELVHISENKRMIMVKDMVEDVVGDVVVELMEGYMLAS
ncbi:hypothetical protein CK203_028362 [Vitis vinifera]|uniref:Uncharacterized protein n=1 Tax=Vitis vinifera TaxID=29760 RepID=A0A438J067_VITVI|nr:hypothetical protein CK203_028362 [Vitis vinifera]